MIATAPASSPADNATCECWTPIDQEEYDRLNQVLWMVDTEGWDLGALTTYVEECGV